VYLKLNRNHEAKDISGMNGYKDRELVSNYRTQGRFELFIIRVVPGQSYSYFHLWALSLA